MNSLSEVVRAITRAKSVELGEEIQSLWSGYGVIQRAVLRHAGSPSAEQRVVIKHVDLSSARTNRRGWGGSQSHQRKVRSYQVECEFYRLYSQQCDQSCFVPRLVAAHEIDAGGGWVIVLEDLDDLGLDRRASGDDERDIRVCLNWLANFHATFMGSTASGLWQTGTYWHLETRPDELAAMEAGPLKRAATAIDQRLSAATYQTLVHGDAKVANFCFSSKTDERVAAVDFQYVGRGCGMKDVAYFISSCLDERQAAAQETGLLDQYFNELETAIKRRQIELDFESLELEWRRLYPFAWADFCRFLAGWSPNHWKLNEYSNRITQTVLAELDLL